MDANVSRTEDPLEQNVSYSDFERKKKQKVLIVDDEKSIRIILKEFLLGVGYEVDLAVDAEDALRTMAEREFDVVVSDIMLPDINGIDLLHRIRAASPFSQVIMITGNPTVKTAAEALRAGAFDYLGKPVDKNTIIKTVNNAARVKAMDDERRQLKKSNDTYRDNLEKMVEERTIELNKVISELQQAQDQQVQQERMNALGQMASGIAHDFNNLLMPILGFSEFLIANRDVLSNVEKSVAMLKSINSAANDAKEVVRRLREFYRPSLDLEMMPVDIKQLLEHVLKLTEPRWKVEADAEGKSISTKIELSDIPVLMANESQLREVFTNIILNAADAMPNGGLLQIVGKCENGLVTIRMIDSGTGMSPDTLKRCMDPFFTTKEERGTGLGLSVCHGIIKNHGGKMQVESEAGKGSTVIVSLPVREESEVMSESENSSKGTFCSLHILCVDDDNISLGLIRIYLSDVGHSVVTADCAEDAIEIFKAGKFDLVITGRAMPGMGGDDMAKSVKQMRKDIIVIMLTGFGSAMEYNSALPEFVDKLLLKPIMQKELLSAIDEAMNLAEKG